MDLNMEHPSAKLKLSFSFCVRTVPVLRSKANVDLCRMMSQHREKDFCEQKCNFLSERKIVDIPFSYKINK